MRKFWRWQPFEVGSLIILLLFFFKFSVSWTMGFFTLGWAIGTLLGPIEQWLMELVERPTEHQVQPKVSLKIIIDKLIRRVDIKQTTLYSPLFLLAYFPLAWFIQTSTGSPLGLGIVMALGWQYVSDLLMHQRDVPHLRQYYFDKFGLVFDKNILYTRMAWLLLAGFALLLTLAIL